MSRARAGRATPRPAVPPPDLDRTRALHLHRARGEPARAGAEQDLAGLCGLLKPGGEVHGLAGRESRLGVLDDDLARLDADPHGQAQRLDRGEDRQRRAQCALRIVLVRERHAERRHHGVARELLDRSAVRLDAARDLLEVPVHTLAHDLGIRTDDEPGRIHEVDEQHRRDLPLHRAMVCRGTRTGPGDQVPAYGCAGAGARERSDSSDRGRHARGSRTSSAR